jgi:hypothetical protein
MPVRLAAFGSIVAVAWVPVSVTPDASTDPLSVKAPQCGEGMHWIRLAAIESVDR